MASIDELDRTWPAKYTMSNKNLILMAHVRDETIFFYDSLGPLTTIILLSEPDAPRLKKVFLDFMNDIGTTVVDLREKESFDPNYKLSQRSIDIIQTLLLEDKYEKVITHPQYSKINDSQNRALYDFVEKISERIPINHYTYNKIGINGSPNMPCDIKDEIIKMYCRVYDPLNRNNNQMNKEMYKNYLSITASISGLRIIK